MQRYDPLDGGCPAADENKKERLVSRLNPMGKTGSNQKFMPRLNAAKSRSTEVL